jgi:hypothetical protein
MPTKHLSYGSSQRALGPKVSMADTHVNVDPRLYAYRHGGIGSSNRCVLHVFGMTTCTWGERELGSYGGRVVVIGYDTTDTHTRRDSPQHLPE